MSDTFSLDIMQSFTEDLSVTLLSLNQRFNLSKIDHKELQLQNLLNEILETKEFIHNSDLFNIHIDLNLDEDVYSVEILLKKELDIEVRKKIYEDFETYNLGGNTKASRNENFTELKLSYK